MLAVSCGQVASRGGGRSAAAVDAGEEEVEDEEKASCSKEVLLQLLDEMFTKIKDLQVCPCPRMHPRPFDSPAGFQLG